jgi:hypothetical protein
MLCIKFWRMRRFEKGLRISAAALLELTHATIVRAYSSGDVRKEEYKLFQVVSGSGWKIFRKRTKTFKGLSAEAKRPISTNEETPLVFKTSWCVMKDCVAPCADDVGTVARLLANGSNEM